MFSRPEQSRKKKHDYLVLLKGRNKYIFRYLPGQEDRLFEVLLEYGRDPSCDLTGEEVDSLIREIRRALKAESRRQRPEATR